MIGLDQLAGMNIHYLYYSLESFCSTNKKLGLQPSSYGEAVPMYLWTVSVILTVQK